MPEALLTGVISRPFFPSPPANPDDLVRWSNAVTVAVDAAFGDLAMRVNDMSQTGPTDDIPESIGDQKLYFDEDENVLYMDTPAGWVAVTTVVRFDDEIDCDGAVVLNVGGIILENGAAVQGDDSGGTPMDLVATSGDDIYFGAAGEDTYLQGNLAQSLYLKNGVYLKGYGTSSSFNLIGVADSTDDIVVGASGKNIQIIGYLSPLTFDIQSLPVTLMQGWGGALTNNLLIYSSNGFEFSNHICIQNNKAIQAKNVSGTADYVLDVSPLDVLTIGGSLFATRLSSNSDIHVNGVSLHLDNGQGLTGNDSGGTARNLIGTSSDNLLVGDSSLSNIVFSTSGVIDMQDSVSLKIGNTVPIKGVVNAGGVARNLIYINSADSTIVGNTSGSVELLSDGTIDANDADLANVENIDPSCTNTRKTGISIADDTWVNFADLAKPGDMESAAMTLWYRVQAVDGSDIQYETGHVTFSGYFDASSTYADSPVEFGTASRASSGTLDVDFSIGTAVDFELRLRYKVNSSLSSPTITGDFGVVMCDGSTFNWNI